MDSASSGRGEGDEQSRRTEGRRRSSPSGAAGLLLRAPAPDGGPLVLLRRRTGHRGQDWELPGGIRNSDEDPVTTALRTTREQTGVDSGQVRVVTEHPDHPADDGSSHTTVLADAPTPLPADHESAEWVPEPEVAALPLHPRLASSWRSLRTRPTTLLVDAANVVGSVPDGWWRDRAAAAHRLLLRCAATVPATLPLPGGELRWVRRCVVVLEGAASAADDVPGLEVVRASGSGDDTLAEIAEHEPEVVLVSADRGLRGRMPPTAASVGPGVLLDRLARQRPAPAGPAWPTPCANGTGPAATS